MKMKKKRLLGLLLSLVMVLGLMPGMSLTAYAANEVIYISDSNVNRNQSGTNWSYNGSTHTLTLSNYRFEGTGVINEISANIDPTVIYYESAGSTFHLVLEGNNTIVQGRQSGKQATWGIYSKSDCEISGTGTLTVSTVDGEVRGAAIYAEKNLTIKGDCTVNATSGSVTGTAQGYGIGGGNGTILTIEENANVTLTGPKGGTNVTVKNAAPGVGWTDVAGNQGEAAIEANPSTGQNLISYNKVMFPAYTVTYKIVNGTWSDSNTTDKTEVVVSGSKPTSVPTGMIASSGYTGGSWDTDPTNATITEATTFTYTFEVAPVASVTSGGTTTNYTDFASAVTAWNSAASGATLTLLADVTMANTINVSGTKILDLNGYGIKKTGSGRVLMVTNGANMTLHDSNATRTDTGANRPDGVSGGYITGGNTRNESGSCVRVESGSAFNMYGGTITGNTLENGGGAVLVIGGNFNMYGGIITGNKGDNNCGGVWVHSKKGSTFNMYCGTITDNTLYDVNAQGVMTTSSNATIGDFDYSEYVAVTFDANGGTGSMPLQKVRKNTDTTIFANVNCSASGISDPAFSREGYDFAGWNTQADGEGTNYTAGTSTINISEATTLYAHWTAHVASVTSDGTTTNYTDFASAVTAWNSAASGATLTLLADVTTNSTLTVSGSKTLDLNDHGIKMTGSGSVIFVGAGAALDLYDNGTTVRYYSTSTSGPATLSDTATAQSFTGGYITGGKGTPSGDRLYGGGVYVKGGSFTMNGGTIFGNGVFSYSGLAGTGGGMQLTGDGSSTGTFTMNGGAFIGNAGQFGGGIEMIGVNGYGYGPSECTINGGEFKHNTCKTSGSAIRITSDTYTSILNINGGTISGNSGNGAVMVYLYGNTQDSAFNLSGKPVISGNLNGSQPCNLRLHQGIANTVGSLGDSANIGVTMQKPGVFTSSSNTDYNDASRFTSDNTSYAVGKNADGQLYLGTACTVTYKVVGGTWSDGTTADKTETVTSGSKPASVPTDMKAAEGFTGGAWDTNPAEATITGATTFTYTFDAIPTYQVTYKVVNGTWSDGTTADKTETVASGSTPASVPTGMKASEGYKGGAWDTNPADATITEATTFTYTFEAKTAAVVTTAPQAKALTSNGSAQELVTAGEASGGKMYYALGTDTTTAPTNGWTTSIPTATEAGTYYVWYKVVGDDNHEDTAPSCVTVNINKAEVTAPAIASKIYNAQLQTADVVESSLYSVTKNEGGTNVGSYDVVLTLTDAANYKWTDSEEAAKTLTFQITQEAATVATPTLSAVTYDPAKTLAYVTLPEGWSWTDPTQIPTVAVGSYAAKLAVDDVNYNWSAVEGYDSQNHCVVRDLSLTVNKAEVALPTIQNKTYTGSVQTADVPGSTLYTVTANAGGTNVGSYDVVLTLTDAANYKWTDSEEAAKTLTFQITQEAATVATPTLNAVTYDPAKTLANVTLPDGWTWADNSIVPAVSNSGYAAVYTVPDDTNYDYSTVEGYSETTHKVTRTVSLTVNKASSTITKAPTANELTYNGTAQELVTPGAADGGDMYYVSTDTNAVPTEGWITSIPTGTDAGTYYVWYKVVGDTDHLDVDPACVTVTIVEPSSNANLALGDDTTNVTVTGLDNLAEESAVDGKTVVVTMTVDKKDKTEVEAADSAAIETAADGMRLEYIDISLTKTVNGEESALTDTNTVLEIVVPYTLSNKTQTTVTVYRYHDGVATKLTEADTKADGTYRLDWENDLIYIYASKFSTYAIGFTPTYKVSGTLSGTFTGTVSFSLTGNGVTKTASGTVTDGKVSYSFTGVPAGTYSVKASWSKNGRAQTLTFPVTVTAATS